MDDNNFLVNLFDFHEEAKLSNFYFIEPTCDNYSKTALWRTTSFQIKTTSKLAIIFE